MHTETKPDELRYPIGPFRLPDAISGDMIALAVGDIKHLPEQLAKVLSTLSDQDLDQCYRPEGWAGRQVVQHLADAHINGYIRFKMALTEDFPSIMPYK